MLVLVHYLQPVFNKRNEDESMGFVTKVIEVEDKGEILDKLASLDALPLRFHCENNPRIGKSPHGIELSKEERDAARAEAKRKAPHWVCTGEKMLLSYLPQC